MASSAVPSSANQPASFAPAESSFVQEKQPEDRKSIPVPSYAAWFDFGTIHEIERRSLPEFFEDLPSVSTGAAADAVANTPAVVSTYKYKSPSLYKEYRDFMIQTYRLNPTEYLSVTTCRRHLSGDAGSVLRVHAFLDQWGLINYQMGAESKVSYATSAVVKQKLFFDTPKGMVPFKRNLETFQNKEGTSLSGLAVANITPVESASKKTIFGSSTAAATSKDIYDEQPNADGTLGAAAASESNGFLNELPAFFCATCGVSLRKGRYHCLKNTAIDLCKICFLEGRFPATFYSGDFVFLVEEAATAVDASGRAAAAWTEQEVFLLLEALEMFQEDWSAIASHVGTRSKAECVLKFLQLPIQESLVTSATCQTEAIPFSDSENPVFTVVSFLASSVHPKVAAAAAKEAIKAADALLAASDASVPDVAVNTEDINKIGGTALGAAAGKAYLLAKNEELQIHRLICTLLEAFLKKLDLKLGQFDEIEKCLLEEMREIEMQRNAVLLERLALKKAATAASVEKSPISESPVLPLDGANDAASPTDLPMQRESGEITPQNQTEAATFTAQSPVESNEVTPKAATNEPVSAASDEMALAAAEDDVEARLYTNL